MPQLTLQPMRARLRLAVVVLLPWTWFVVREAGSGLDAIATVLPVVVALAAAGLAVFSLRRRDRGLAIAGLSLALMGTTSVVGPWRVQPGLDPVLPVRIVHANVSEGNHRLERALADLLAQPADIMVVTEATQRADERLSTAFPHRVVTGDQLILSRYPLELLTRPEGFHYDGERIQVTAPGERFILYPIHMARPHLHDPLRFRTALRVQRREVAEILEAIGQEALPVVLAGDFNISDRTRSYRDLARRMKDAMRTAKPGPTYVRPPYRLLWLRIDHVFESSRWCGRDARRFPVAGSDHRGIAVAVGACPQRRHEE